METRAIPSFPRRRESSSFFNMLLMVVLSMQGMFYYLDSRLRGNDKI